jgi:hypothetical protein
MSTVGSNKSIVRSVNHAEPLALQCCVIDEQSLSTLASHAHKYL